MPIEPTYNSPNKQQLRYPLDIQSTGVINDIISKSLFKKKNIDYKVVEVTVGAGNTSGQSSADDALIGGVIMGYYPSGNQDQFVDSVTLASDGRVIVSLANNATADNTFKVMILK